MSEEQDPCVRESIRIADTYLAGATVDQRKALAIEILSVANIARSEGAEIALAVGATAAVLAPQANDNMKQTSDGCLLATTFNVNLCDGCGKANFDLMDTVGNRFASAAIAPESFREIAAWFTGAAELFEANSERTH